MGGALLWPRQTAVPSSFKIYKREETFDRGLQATQRRTVSKQLAELLVLIVVWHTNPKHHRAIISAVHIGFQLESRESFTKIILQGRFIGLVLLTLRLSQSRIIIFSSKPKDCKSPVFVFRCQNLQRLCFHFSPEAARAETYLCFQIKAAIPV